MGSIYVRNLGKAYKQYHSRWARLFEWCSLRKKIVHSLKWVLRDVSFSIKSGESVGIMGVNGAGKSTLLKMICGTTRPTEGRVDVSGRVAALLELGMGFHPDFTGRQNVFMTGQLLGMRADELDALFPEIEAFAEIGDYIDQPLRVYSSGMQVRLAFSLATAMRPDILIVDEALSVGDPYFQAKCYKRIAAYKAAGTTLLLVTHSVDEVVKHCERAILLKDGALVADASSKEVSNLYLNLLFGKKNNNKAPMAEVNKDLIIFDNKSENLFHTRMGYNKEELRWGHGGAQLIDYKVVVGNQDYPDRIDSGDRVDFYFKVFFEENFENVVPGFLIKTIEGIFLYGTNSLLMMDKYESISVSAGQVAVYRFSLPVHLNEGTYLISFGISSGNSSQELVPLDRRYDSVLISVGRELPFWGIADLGATFSLV